jgi:hypothetical protein
MKQILIEIDDRCARDLEQVAPAKNRRRAEFVRLAIRRAIDLALDRNTRKAYGARPLPSTLEPSDLAGWDPRNRLAVGLPRKAVGKKRRKSAA